EAVNARVQVKVCGVRRVGDARLAVALGAGWIGCVRAADSPRCASSREAAAIRRAVEGRARFVLVGRGTPVHTTPVRMTPSDEERRHEREVVETLLKEAKRVHADAVQIHGASRAAVERVRDAGLVAWRVIPVVRGTRRLPRQVVTARSDTPVLLDVGAG